MQFLNIKKIVYIFMYTDINIQNRIIFNIKFNLMLQLNHLISFFFLGKNTSLWLKNFKILTK